MKEESENLKSLDRFFDEQVGEKGAKKRAEFENDYENFKLGVLIQQARKEKGLTQQQVAETHFEGASPVPRPS